MTPVILITLGFATLLVLVSVLVPIAKRLQLPFTVLLAIVGAALGFAPYLSGGDLGSFKVVIDALGALQIPAEGFLYVFLPPLLFAGGLTVDVRRLFDDIWPVLVLAIVAVLMCMIAVGLTLNLVTGTSLMLCLLLGAIVATTDTAAVLGIFRDIGVPSRLSVIVEGESLFNDAAAIALFVVILEVVSGHGEANLGAGALEFAWGFLGGLVFGYIMAWLSGVLISQLRGAAVTEITISVALAYMTFVVGQAFLHISGIIAVVTAAMIFASDTRTRLSPGTWETLQITWRQLEFWGTSLIFILAAMLAPRMLGSVQWIDAVAIGALFVAAMIARAIVLWLLLPVLSWFGLSQPISNVYKIVLCWGGLRGAVTIALALLAASELGGSAYGPELPPEARFIFVMAMGYVLATLLIAAPTLRPLMKFLKLDKLSPEERLVRDRVMALSRGRVHENLVQVAHALGLSDSVVRQTEQMVQADVVGGGKLGRDDLVLAGLIVVANRETELSLEYLQRGLVGRTVAERLRADAGRVLDGVRLSGNVGYLSAALRDQRPSRRFKAALWLQRSFGWSGLLADEIANRFELLLVKQLMLRELLPFADAKVAQLIGQHAAFTVKEALEGRVQAISGAIAALDLQYPDFTKAMRARYLERLAIGLEEAEYRGQHAQSLISTEVFESLEEDRSARRQVASSRPSLDLGLKLAEMLGKVPIFAGLKEDQIARLAQMLTPELFTPGERVIRAGDQGDKMYFIAAGIVDVLIVPDPVRLKTGDFFGEMALLNDKPRNADVVSAGYTNMLVLKRRDFEALLKAHAGLREKIEEIARKREAENTRPATVAGK
ncbi:MAG: cyclic nucleotide-binding domain-containing protein [Alphaproteobacteria bacterium]|nr:cyclic nucleotide-binding domain-containing protein [Alphaproteobacteria bacterium]